MTAFEGLFVTIFDLQYKKQPTYIYSQPVKLNKNKFL